MGRILLPAALLLLFTQLPTPYKGTPFHDARHSTTQTIPGRVELALYDQGGEGIAYHDGEPRNLGSGTLNPPDGSYLNEFRTSEGVDTSYTKFHNPGDPIDDSPYNRVQPPENQLYVGWTEPGEWFRITVDVARPGTYTADLLYTSQRGGTISIGVDGQPTPPALTIPSTFNPADPIAWRQWHHWNLAPALVKLKLPAGPSTLTVRILSKGNMNLATLNFKPAP